MNASPSLLDPQPPTAHAVASPARLSGSAVALPPILWPCGAVLVASALGPSHHDAWAVVAAFAIVMALLAGVARSGGAWIVAMTFIALAVGLVRTGDAAPRTVQWPTASVNAVRGTVAMWPSPHGETVQVPVTVIAARTGTTWQFATATLRATLPTYPPLNRGDLIVIGGTATIRRNWLPDADGTLFGQWVRVEQHDGATTLTDIRHRAVARFIAGIAWHVRSPEAGLTAGMLLGEKAVLDTQTRDALNATGTTQHVVISGWNISIVIGLFAALGRNLTLRRRRAWALAALATVIVYTFAVGADLSVVRAAVMGGAALVAPLVGRRADPLVWLAIACATMALIDPTVTQNLSFLLSAAATFGVLVVAPWLADLARRFNACRRFPRLTELGAVAIAAYLMTEPIILHAFGRVSLISPVVNIIVEPLVPVIMGIGFITALLSFLPIPLLADVAGLCTSVPAWLFLRIITAAGALPFSAVQLPQPGLGVSVFLYAVPACIALRSVIHVPALRASALSLRRQDVALYGIGFVGTLIVALGVAVWFR
ncbi:MAG: ComEC/Rec2 family competence protein [Thermomicrobiales bacterium]